MGVKNYKIRLCDLKERAIDKVDYHFNQYILTDLLETGDSDYFLIDSVNWAIYWTDLLADLKNLMDKILNAIDTTNKKEKYESLIIECIEIKRIVDANVIKYELDINKEDNIDIYDVFSHIGIKAERPKIPEPITLSKDDKILKKLHRGLTQTFGYIDVAFPEFCLHFRKGEKSFTKIRWKAVNQDLAMLIVLLLKHDIIAKIYTRRINQISIITTHFKNSSGNSFPIKSTRTLLRRMEELLDSPAYKKPGYEEYKKLSNFLKSL